MCQFVEQEEKFIASDISSSVWGLRDDKHDSLSRTHYRAFATRDTTQYLVILILIIIIINNHVFFITCTLNYA